MGHAAEQLTDDQSERQAVLAKWHDQETLKDAVTDGLSYRVHLDEDFAQSLADARERGDKDAFYRLVTETIDSQFKEWITMVDPAYYGGE